MARERRVGAEPRGMEPMYAVIGEAVPPDEGWTFEPKYDGVRVLAHAEAGSVALVTRNGRDKARQFPEVAGALAALTARLGSPLVLDGEIVALVDGRPARFQRLQRRTHLRGEPEIRARAERDPTALIAFDLLRQGEEWLLDAPWAERRARLEQALRGGPAERVRLGETHPGGGAEMLEEARRTGWEGIIAKRTDAPYRPGKRSDQWLKLKVEFRQEFVVGGWTEPQRSRQHLGSLLVGYYDGDRLRFAGGVGTGFDRRGLEQMADRLRPLERKTPPFHDPPRTRTPAHWVRPELVVEIKFSEWTADARLRTPVFLGLREDKPARDVTREGRSAQRGG